MNAVAVEALYRLRDEINAALAPAKRGALLRTDGNECYLEWWGHGRFVRVTPTKNGWQFGTGRMPDEGDFDPHRTEEFCDRTALIERVAGAVRRMIRRDGFRDAAMRARGAR